MNLRNLFIKYLTVKGHIKSEQKIVMDHELKKDPMWDQLDDTEKEMAIEKAYEEFKLSNNKKVTIINISAVVVVFFRYFIICSFILALILNMSGQVA
jgi:hypothetical protein